MNFPLIVSIKSAQISKLERENIKKYKPFGVILFKRNILNFNQTKNLIKIIKSLHPKINVLIDQEGGIVNRFSKLKEFNFLNNFDYYQSLISDFKNKGIELTHDDVMDTS